MSSFAAPMQLCLAIALGGATLSGQSFASLPRAGAPVPAVPPPGAILGERYGFADLDGDARVDVIGSSSIVAVYNWLGSGQFARREPLPMSIGYFGIPPIGDVDGDGDLDMMAAYGQQTVTPSLFINNGDGTFVLAPERLEYSTAANWSLSVVLIDIDNGGDLDAAFAAASAFMPQTIMLNDGSGNFSVDPGRDMPPRQVSGVTWKFAAPDLNNDGFADLLFINRVRPSDVWINDGTGHFALGFTFPTSTAYHWDWQLGDINGDGHVDVLMFADTLYRSPPLIYLNDGNAVFTAAPSSWRPHSTPMNGGVLSDVDEDGDLDIVSSHMQPQPVPGSATDWFDLEVWLNDGTGNFTDMGPRAMPPLEAGHEIGAVSLGDMDGDGDQDCITAWGTNHAPRRPLIYWNLHRHLYCPFEARAGQPYRVQVWAPPFHPVGLFLSFGRSFFDVGDLGVFELDPASLLVFPAELAPADGSPLEYDFTMTTDPNLIGLTLHWQAIDVDPSVLTDSRFMAAWWDTILP